MESKSRYRFLKDLQNKGSAVIRGQRVYIFINGILTRPSDQRGWTDRAETWIDTHNLPYKTRSYEYFSPALLRRLMQWKRVKDVIALIEQYKGFEIVLVGHSNGCDIICRVLKQYEWKIHSIHLIAGACDADFEKNGINPAIEENRLGEVFVYASANDSALKLAKATSWLGKVGLGYGYLGLTGPENVSEMANERLCIHSRNEFDHSTWFDEKQFDETMRMIVCAQI